MTESLMEGGRIYCGSWFLGTQSVMVGLECHRGLSCGGKVSQLSHVMAD